MPKLISNIIQEESSFGLYARFRLRFLQILPAFANLEYRYQMFDRKEIMSLSIERVLSEIDQLTLVEQMQVLEHLVKQIKQSVAAVTVTQKPKYKVTDFYGIAPDLLGGIDAQEWVNQSRNEWEERETWRQIK